MIQFLEPNKSLYLLFLVPVLLVLIWSYRVQSLRLSTLRQLVLSKNSYIIKGALKVLILLLLILTLLRPYNGLHEVTVGNNGRDNVIIMDVSLSMLAKDILPSRLEVAKRKIFDLISLLRENSAGDRIGIILFAGEAYLYCPVTQDFATVSEFAKSISTELITAQGSGIGQALTLAGSIIKRSELNYPRLFLFTDGEDPGISNNDTTKDLLSQKIKPLIIGFGKTEGTPIDIGRGQYLKDNYGTIVISKLNEGVLKEIEEKTDGKYTPVSINDTDLRSLLSFDTNNTFFTNNSETESKVTVYHEVGSWIALGILVLILGFFIFGKSSWVFALILISLSFSEKSFAESIDTISPTSSPSSASAPSSLTLKESYDLYSNGDFEGAKKGFESHWLNDPTNAELNQALGSAYYKLGEYKKATHLFKQAYELSKTGKQKFEALYNQGNSELMAKEYDKAIKSYEDALNIKKDDEKANFNLELAKKLLEEKEERKKERKEEKEEEKEEEKKNNNKETEEKKNEQKDQSDQNSSDQNNSDDQDPQDQPDQNQDGQPDQKEDENKDKESDSTDESKQNQAEAGKDQDEPKEANGSETQDSDIKEGKTMDQIEAEQWLQSLPSAPILLQKKSSRNRPKNGQTW